MTEVVIDTKKITDIKRLQEISKFNKKKMIKNFLIAGLSCTFILIVPLVIAPNIENETIKDVVQYSGTFASFISAILFARSGELYRNEKNKADKRILELKKKWGNKDGR